MSEPTLALALGCLGDLGVRLVVVGGTAHRMFPRHPLGRDPGFELLTTEDVDLAAPLELQHDGSRNLLDRLEAAGFTEELRGAEYATRVYRPPDHAGSYLEFIAPLRGDGDRRDGTRDRLMRFSGIHAQKLRHVDLLLHRPWPITTHPPGRELTVRVVHPVAFLVQKLLALPDRAAKRGKDLLYVFDTLTLFGDELDALAVEAETFDSALPPRARRQLRSVAHQTCFRDGDVAREAAAIAATQRRRPPDSEQIVGACELGLRRVLRPLIPDL